MKKLFAALLLLSCNANTNKTSYSDSIASTPEFKAKVDSMVNSGMQNAFLEDTNYLQNAPVKVISARPLQQEYSSYKSIRLTYKNISAKTISGVKFRWYGLNAFGDPADMGGITDGFGGGFSDDELRPGKTDGGTWDILSRDLKKVIKAWPYEVAFKDGTKWELKTK